MGPFRMTVIDSLTQVEKEAVNWHASIARCCCSQSERQQLGGTRLMKLLADLSHAIWPDAGRCGLAAACAAITGG